MDRELWKQVDALLEQALEQPPAEREAFVLAASQDNPALRDEVLSLLKAQAQAAGFMERSAMNVAAHALGQDSRLTTIVSTLVGQELESYRIEKLLGAGGMGEVYLARDLKLGRPVALKVLPLHFVVDADRLSRFQREARALSSLNHPNLVTIYEVGEANGLHFIAMELVEGKALSALRGKLSLKDLLSIVAQVAEALGAAHQSGIIHRDVKPDNVMVRADGYAKVLDFGLVKLAEVEPAPGSAAQTKLGVAMGTLAYMSPEQASGELVDHRTDIWSLGVVLYELATGQKPFTAETRQATINLILSRQPEDATSIDASLPPELDRILNRALEKDRELRYQTVSDFRADIRRLLRQIDSSPSGSGSGEKYEVVQIVRRGWLWPAVVGLLILTATFVWFVWLKAKPATLDWSRAAHLQLTNEHGTEFYPSLAPDGRSFVYASKQSGNFDLFVQRVGGKNATPLTPNTPSDESSPVFSPDGERIAFRSTREPAGVYVMEASGENVRLVVAGCFHPSWSPDGKEIVCSTAGHDEAPTTRNTWPSALWIANVETGEKRFLCENDAMMPSWSPNGNRIAFWFMPPSAGRSDIATISRNGGELEVVTKDASTNWNPVWSPDGKFLYFASDRSGNMSFWRVAIDEETGKVQGEAEVVSTPATFNRHLSFSRNGRRMIYVQTDQQSNIQAINFNGEKTVGEPFWITRGDRHIVRPELSPDGTRFVMRVSRRTQDDIIVVSRDGTQWRDLTNDKFFDRYPRWSPDGKRIAFTSDRGGRYEIWMLDADATNLRQLTFNTPGDTSFPLWSPDGTQILFRSNLVNSILDVNKPWSEQNLRLLPMAPDNQRFVAWDWSPDGKRLVGNLSGPPLVVAVYSFETNQYEKLTEFGSSAMWLPDSTRFVFVFDNKLYLGDVKTKRVREIFSFGEDEIRSVDVSPDGKLVYYSAYNSESDIWLLDLE